MLAHFPAPTFFVAFFSDFVCSILLVLGLGTRWAALYCFGNIFIAWAFIPHFAFFAKGPGTDHGELMVLYLGSLFTLLIAARLSLPGPPSLANPDFPPTLPVA